MKRYWIILLLLLSSCNASKNGVLSAESSASIPKIIFLNYKISKNSEGKVDVSLINKMIVDGELKTETLKEHSPENGRLVCSQLDKNSMPLQKKYLPDPLSRTIEYADESGTFSKKKIELDSAEFSVRMQLAPLTKMVLLEYRSENHVKTLKCKL